MAALDEHELRVVLDAIPAPVFYKDAAGVYVGCNRAFEAYLGKRRDEIVGKDVYGLSPQDFADVYKAADDRLFAKGGTQIYEARVRYADGTYHDVVFHKATFADAEGRLAGLVGTILDVTARKRAQDALSLFRALVDHSTDTFEVIDPVSGRFLDINETACLEHGYSREEYLRLSIFELDPTVDRARFGRMAEEVGTTGPVTLEGTRRRKDGSSFPAEVSLKRVRLDRDYLVAVVRNVTERMRVEAEHLRFMLGVSRSADAIFMTGLDGTISYVNPAFERLYGFSKAEAIGKNPRLLKSGAQDAAFYPVFWQRLLANEVVQTEMVNQTKDGKLIHVDATVNPIIDDRGVTIGFLAIQRDITERKQAAEHREKLEERLRASQKMEAIGSLAGGIAHDFNNLLSVVLGSTNLILEELKPDDSIRPDIERVQRAGERARDLTRQLLAFGRRQVLKPKPSDLNQILAGMGEMVGRLLGEDIELSMKLGEGLGVVHADPGQLEQVVMNLVVNARDALPRGGAISIETDNTEHDENYAADHPGAAAGRYVVMTVRDNGIGMDEATQARIFEPFFTTKETGKGTGLGLSTVFGIVQQSGGHLSVVSRPGEGATFKVHLPRIDLPTEVPTRAAPQDEVGRGTETILLVDDDDQVRIVVRAMLRRRGYAVLDAPNGAEALRIFEEVGAEIRLLLTDVVMPRMSGPELAGRLTQIRPGLKVLFMSGYTDDSIVRHGVGNSEVTLLHKPVSPDELAAKVRSVLDK